MGQRHDEITGAGARVAGISVDPVEANAAMVSKLHLPFPLLSDPEGQDAIKPYEVWNDKERGGIAMPAVVLVDPEGEEVFRQVGRDFADRTTEDELVEALGSLALPAVDQEPPETGPEEPSDEAMPVRAMTPYFKGAKLAVTALGRRHRDITEDTKRYAAAMDRYLAAVKHLR